MTSKEEIYLDDIPSRAILVWQYLCNRENAHHQCWPSINRMASDLHIGRSTVKRALHDLTEAGWITAELRHRPDGSDTSRLYTLHHK